MQVFEHPEILDTSESEVFKQLLNFFKVNTWCIQVIFWTNMFAAYK